MTEPWDITDDDELIAAVRAETQYDRSDIDDPTLYDLLESAKRMLALKGGVTSFYSDRGLSVALLGITCAKAKGAVENSPVRVDNVGANDVTFRTSDGSSLQVGEYESMTELGLAESDKTDAGTQELELANAYLNDQRSA